jgi:hypothetical protein
LDPTSLRNEADRLAHIKKENIASCHHIKEDNIATPVQRSELLQGMKRMNYKEKIPKSKDYGDSENSDNHSLS